MRDIGQELTLRPRRIFCEFLGGLEFRSALLDIPGMDRATADELIGLVGGPRPPTIELDFREVSSPGADVIVVMWKSGSVRIPFRFARQDGRIVLREIDLRLPRLN